MSRFRFIASFSLKTIVKYSVFDAPTAQSIVFYAVFATPKIEFLLKVSKNIVKHTLLDHPKKPVLAMNGKRVSFAPQSEHPNASLESFSELLFVLSCMSFMRVLWTWVEGGQASLRSAFRCVGSFSSSFWRYVKPSWRHLATTWRQDGALERQDGPR